MKRRFTTSLVSVVALSTVSTLLAVVPSASAYEGEFAKFDYCAVSTPEVFKCIDSVTGGGEIVLGSKATPIVNPVTLQGGFSKANEEHISKFFGATNGETLSKTPQPVPGGLLGVVPPEESPALIKELEKFFFENELTGLNATLELAKPASEIQISEYDLELQEGTALKLPVKVHLENPFMGRSCYVGSGSSPLIWNLTTGTTSPPPPNEAISGKSGKLKFKEKFQIAEITEDVMVDNAWSAPGATGCGGILSFLVDPVIDSVIGLPSASGHNTAILDNTISVAGAKNVSEH